MVVQLNVDRHDTSEDLHENQLIFSCSFFWPNLCVLDVFVTGAQWIHGSPLSCWL